MEKNKFNQIYKNIINENYKPFKRRSGDRDLPQEYLVNLPQIKQCILPNHFGRAVADQDDPKKNYFISNQILYRNIQLFLQKIFSDKNLVRKINNSEIQSYTIECLCNTSEQFDRDKNKHLVIPFMINAKEISNGIFEYYVLAKTLEIKNIQAYSSFVKNGYKSTRKEHNHQIPVIILGEDVE